MNTTHLKTDTDDEAERAATLAELKHLFRRPTAPVPTESLQRLFDAACQDTGGSQAARNFLFWLAGQPDPTGYTGHGGIELRRLDGQLKESALQVLTWWSGPTKSDQPLYEILRRLNSRFDSADTKS
jgi:hypothetical protein